MSPLESCCTGKPKRFARSNNLVLLFKLIEGFSEATGVVGVAGVVVSVEDFCSALFTGSPNLKQLKNENVNFGNLTALLFAFLHLPSYLLKLLDELAL